MKLTPVSIMRKANILKIGGTLGGAVVATVVLELVTQALTKTSASAARIGSDAIPGVNSLPVIGSVSLKDVPSLIPAAAGGIAILKGRTKAGAMMVIGSVGAKAGLRAAGLNPDELWGKVQSYYHKHFSKNVEEDYEPEVYF